MPEPLTVERANGTALTHFFYIDKRHRGESGDTNHTPMQQKLSRAPKGIRLLILAFMALLPSLRLVAADGDVFNVDGIMYQVISEADKTCRTRRGEIDPRGMVTPGQSKNLNSYNLSSNPKGYTLVEIGAYGFYGIDLSTFTIPETVTMIGESAFSSTNLKSMVIPGNVKNIGKYAFSTCSRLADITLQDGITHIGSYAFRNCGLVQNITIPSSVTQIDDHAFKGTGLRTITVPASVKELGTYVFENCNLNPLILESDFNSSSGIGFLYGLSSCTILCKSSSLGALKEKLKESYSTAKYAVYQYDCLYNIEMTPTPTGCTLKVKENSYFNLKDQSKDYKIVFTYTSDKGQEQFFELDEIGIGEYKVTGAPMNTEITAVLSWNVGDTEYSQNFTATTRSLAVIPSNGIKYTTTPTSITIDNIEYTEESGINISEVGVYYEGKKYPFKDKLVFDNLLIHERYQFIPYATYNEGKAEYKGGIKYIDTDDVTFRLSSSSTQTSITISNLTYSPSLGTKVLETGVIIDGVRYPNGITLSNLLPEKYYNVDTYIIYGDNQFYSKYYDGISTKEWNIGRTFKVGPTTLSLNATINSNNIVKPTECWWEVAGVKYPGYSIVATGLQPDTKYTPVFYWTYEASPYQKKTYSRNTFPAEVTTSKLTLNTLNPKCVSPTCAIVAAETNILDVEPLVGFQWKKYDSPSTLAPSEGFGAVCDGMVEGYIRNLQSTSFYNVRAFYKTAKGTYYYGQWITFDPSDFSFFEPSVRTYPVQEVGDNKASVRGYALAGTEDIKSQGFQYWPSNSPQSVKMYAPASSEVYTVLASGQIMTATLDDLFPGTTYTYRAFVETATGFTYGDEQTFTTTDISGIGAIDADPQQPEIIGYFDLSGRRYTTLQRGVNIIVFSDGTTRKVIGR